MHRAPLASVASLLLSASLASVPCLAGAQTAPTPPAQPPAAAAPAPATPSPYMEKVATGMRTLLSGDYDGAIGIFRQATQLEPSNPEAFFLIGEAMRVKRSYGEALTPLRTALNIARQTSSVLWEARALASIADTLERMEGSLEEARTAWNEYATYGDSHRDVSFPDVARARVTAIDAELDARRVAADVRRRAEERERASNTRR